MQQYPKQPDPEASEATGVELVWFVWNSDVTTSCDAYNLPWIPVSAAMTIFTEKVFQERNAVNNSVLKFFEIDWVTSGLQNAAETRGVHSVLCGRVNNEMFVEQSTLWDIYETCQRTRAY